MIEHLLVEWPKHLAFTIKDVLLLDETDITQGSELLVNEIGSPILEENARLLTVHNKDALLEIVQEQCIALFWHFRVDVI